MHLSSRRALVCACTFGFSFALASTRPVAGQPQLGTEQLVQAGSGPIAVTGYSVPSVAFWNDDNLPDLIVGEGPIGSQGKVRVYLNQGTPEHPSFSTFPSATSFYAQSNGADLWVSAANCLGAFPRIWDTNSKDLLVGQSDGKVRFYTNLGGPAAPTYDGGTFLQAGPAGSKVDINVGARATCIPVDWDNNGVRDLMVGTGIGTLQVFVNHGSNAIPDFATGVTVRCGSSDLDVGDRASPVFMDLDGDGRRDLLSGNMAGQLLFYKNTGSNETPAFSAASSVLAANGQPFVLSPGSYPRTRPFVCDWNGDNRMELLLGAYGGNVRVYTLTPEPGTLGLAGAGLALLLHRRRILFKRKAS